MLLPIAIFCTLMIGYLSLADISSLPKLKVEYEDKFYHLAAYFLLNTIWLIALKPFTSRGFKSNILISLGILTFGIVIEIFQELLTDIRVFDYYDILSNSIGIILSYLCFQFFGKRIFENINSK
ncbi:hypothetical protein SAMN04488027_102175 [Psychroflexus sediminis]|uniref:VanZ like family protein n=2 Tax=Psychroflexus sediminis TaxID=470826 RepID=A0A1G7UMZ1_9FLAO|nr:hypothetical protein SAMN04488027_102175 [Psychroflexus sediminis]